MIIRTSTHHVLSTKTNLPHSFQKSSLRFGNVVCEFTFQIDSKFEKNNQNIAFIHA
jgi:hypothetical protein